MNYRFEDYKVVTGTTKMGKPYAAIEEFAGLAALGESTEQAIKSLRQRYEERVALHLNSGKPIPAPGSRKARIGFAPDDKIRELGFVVIDFWEKILGTSRDTSFISNGSRLSSWQHYCGGREFVIRKVFERYGVDISSYYDEPIPIILKRIKEGPVWRASHDDK